MEEVMERLGDDLLIGGHAVAEYLFGEPRDDAERKRQRRKLYNLRERLPLFNIGPQIAGRKSTLNRFVENKERAATESA
jgi:hypothetical protein